MSNEVETSLAVDSEMGARRELEIPRLRCAALGMTKGGARCGFRSLSGQFQLLARYSAQFEKADQGLFDQIVGHDAPA